MSIYEADIIVVGAGLGGVVASLSARRRGAKVLLLEKNPIPGGMAVAAQVHSMLTFHGVRGHRIIGGIPQEIIDRLKIAGGTCGHLRDTIGVAYSVTPTDSCLLALVLQDMLEEAGVYYLLESRYLESAMDGEVIRSIRGVHQGGLFTATAPLFIDASGEGSLAAASGCPFEQGRDGKSMPATLIFSLRDIDIQKICDFAVSNPSEFHHETHFDHLKESRCIGISGFFTMWREADLSIPRDRLLFYRTLQNDEVSVNSTRIIDFDPFDPDKLKKAYREARRQVYELCRFLRMRVSGFERCRISRIAPFIGVREGRRIKGRYWLTGEDVVKGRRFPDEIAFGGFPVDIHLPGSMGIETERLQGEGFYGIPYRSLLPENVTNLLIVGKCLSASFEAHASARVQATTMAMGQAAGIAAAIAGEKNRHPLEIHPDEVREGISHQGAILQPEAIDELPW